MRPPFQVAFLLALLNPLSSGALLSGGENERDHAAKAAHAALAKLDKCWKPYDNKPNLDDQRWKVLMEGLVDVVRAGPAATPVLEAAAKVGSPWSESTRAFAAKVLQIVQGPALVRNAIADYDLAKMDTARVGKPAPDFALTDAGGKSYGLIQFRGKRVVVLTFVVADT